MKVREMNSENDTPVTDGDTLLVLKGVRKRYGSVEALKGIDLRAQKGECLVILGPSGAGKTTTLKVIAGLEDVQEGTITFQNRILNNLEPKDRNVAMAFETYALYPHITVYENLASSLRALRMDEEQVKESVRNMAMMLGIYPFLDRRPGFLSGGQRQRVALGRALIKPVGLYLMDEPIAHLDAKLRYQMIGEFKHLQETLRISLLYVTHDWREAMSLGNHIAVLNNGVIEQFGTKDELFNRPVDTFVAQMIGDPPMNLLKGRIVDGTGSSTFQSGRVSIPLGERLEKGDAILGIRSAKVQLASSSTASLEAEVYSCGKRGMNTVVSMRVGEDMFKTEFKGQQKFDIGENIPIRFDLSRACLFNNDNRLMRVLGEKNG
jgi:ABC-type sugar transport system ATPase subunit